MKSFRGMGGGKYQFKIRSISCIVLTPVLCSFIYKKRLRIGLYSLGTFRDSRIWSFFSHSLAAELRQSRMKAKEEKEKAKAEAEAERTKRREGGDKSRDKDQDKDRDRWLRDGGYDLNSS